MFSLYLTVNSCILFFSLIYFKIYFIASGVFFSLKSIFSIIGDFFYFWGNYTFTWKIYEYIFFKYHKILLTIQKNVVFHTNTTIIDTLFNTPLFFSLQTLFLVIISVWARAVGPRMRMDQLMQIVWKDFIPHLTAVILIFLSLIIFF